MNKSAKELLQNTRRLLSDRKRWTQGTLARDITGNEVSPTDSEAVCWCLFGAIDHEDHKGDFAPSALVRAYYAMFSAYTVFDKVPERARIPNDEIVDYSGEAKRIERLNDRSAHLDVLEFLDIAIRWAPQ